MIKKEIFRMEHITKNFFGIKALNDVRFNIYQGEIIGLTGLNLSGKSTLAKIISGIFSADNGTIYYDEEKIELKSGYEESRQGIYYVCRESTLFPKMTVRKNIFSISTSKNHNIIINEKREKVIAEELMQLLNIDLDQNEILKNLSYAQINLIHICRALAINSKVIILDDITGTYDQQAITKLMEVLLKVQSRGVSVIYINNRLDDVFDNADRVVILERGKNLWTFSKDQYTREEAIKIISGNKYKTSFNIPRIIKHDEILRVDKLGINGSFKDISFKLSKGDILGMLIADESIRNKVGESLFGLNKKAHGDIYIDKKAVRITKPKDAIKHGIGFIPEHSFLKCYFDNMDIKKNLSFLLPGLVKPHFGIINSKLDKYVGSYGLSNLKINDFASSGILTNLEKSKIILQRWMILKPKILIIVNPALGLDFIAKEQVYSMIRKISSEGTAIILISSDISELSDLSERIMIINEGSRSKVSKSEVVLH